MKYLPDNFETISEALGRARDVMRDLSNAGFKVPKCTHRHHCQLEHCHKCLRRFRKSLMNEGARLGFHHEDWLEVTLLPNTPPIPIGKLDEFLDLAKEVEKHTTRLRRHIPIALVIGGIDVALLIRDRKVLGWQPHLHLYVHGIDAKCSLKALRKAYPKSSFAPNPIHHKPVDRMIFFSRLVYTYKSIFFPRGDPCMVPKGKSRPSLPRQYDLELRAFLAKWSIGSRLILRNARNYPKRNKTQLQIRLRHPFNLHYQKLSSGSVNHKAIKRKNTTCRRVKGPSRTK